MRVVFATPTRDKPHKAYLEALEACLPAVEAAGFTHQVVFEIGCPYISAARARMLAKALKAGFDYIVFLDDDVSWTPDDMAKLLKADGDVVGGTYRYKQDETKYMGLVRVGNNRLPLARYDGAIEAIFLPAGFLRVSYEAIWKFASAFPQLILHREKIPSVDIFNHGAHEGHWFGEDYSFTRRWAEIGGEVWCIPDLDLTHNGPDKAYPGNLHKYLLEAGKK